MSFFMSADYSLSTKVMEIIYFIIGLLCIYCGVKNLKDKENPEPVGTFIFWAVLGVVLALGRWLPSLVSGILVVVMCIPAILKKVKKGAVSAATKAETEATYEKIGMKIFVPTLSIGMLAVICAITGLGIGLSALNGVALGVLVAIILLMIMNRDNKPSTFLNDSERMLSTVGPLSMLPMLLACLGSVFTAAGVPIGFFGVNFTANAFGTSLELNIVKHMEFEFRSDDHFVGNAGFTHVFNSALDNVAGILIERAVLGAVDNHCIAAHGEGRNLRKGIDSSGGKVGNEDHIAVFNGCVAVVGTIKADAVFHRVFIKTGGGDGDMTPTTIDIGHFEIDHFNFIVKDEFLCLLNCFKQHG